MEHQRWGHADSVDPDVQKEALRNWRSWGSWFSWGSPVGMGIFLVSVGAFLVLLHLANLLGR